LKVRSDFAAVGEKVSETISLRQDQGFQERAVPSAELRGNAVWLKVLRSQVPWR